MKFLLLAQVATAILHGTVKDDGLPNGKLTYTWSKISGPAPVTILYPHQLQTSVKFTVPGVYVFQLQASDGQLTGSDRVKITVVSQ